MIEDTWNIAVYPLKLSIIEEKISSLKKSMDVLDSQIQAIYSNQYSIVRDTKDTNKPVFKSHLSAQIETEARLNRNKEYTTMILSYRDLKTEWESLKKDHARIRRKYRLLERENIVSGVSTYEELYRLHGISVQN